MRRNRRGIAQINFRRGTVAQQRDRQLTMNDDLPFWRIGTIAMVGMNDSGGDL